MITDFDIKQGTTQISIQVIRSGRKSIGLEVRPDGVVLARIPYRLPDRELKAFIEKYRDWIFQKYMQTEKRTDTRQSTEAKPLGQLTAEELESMKKKIAERVGYYCAIMGVTVGKITIRNQKTRWGSCSGKGNLNFNYQLCYLPEELLDYVVVHELAHRRHMNHSAEFWAEVEKYYPNYKECRKRLRGYRLEL